MNLNYLKIEVNKIIETREGSKHREEILELYELCLYEIENGESVDNEIRLCINSINSLLDETI